MHEKNGTTGLSAGHSIVDRNVDGLVKLEFLIGVGQVTFTDKIVMVLVAEYLAKINYIFDRTSERICQWMDSDGLKIAEHKMVGVFIIISEVAENIESQVGVKEPKSIMLIPKNPE